MLWLFNVRELYLFHIKSIGVEDGGMGMQPNRKLKNKVKPFKKRESVEVNVSTLGISDFFKVVDIREKIPYDILNENDYTIVTVPQLLSDGDLKTTAENILTCKEDTSFSPKN